jgi:polyphosphate kinase
MSDRDGEGEPGTARSGEPGLTDPELYLNRELSELAFQRRVLAEARDERTPTLERVRFLSILTRNLDEFFMKRVGGLKQQVAGGVSERSPDGRTPEQQLQAVRGAAGELLADAARCYRTGVRPALAADGIEIVDYADTTAAERDRLREYFEASVLPTLTPLTFDPARPFPFISNLSLSLAVLTRGGPAPGREDTWRAESDDGGLTFSRVKIPGNRPRLVELEAGRYVRLEELVAANLELLFPDVAVVDCSAFRVTRNAEVRRNEEVAEGLVEMIEGVLRDRRFATVVRVEVEPDTPERVRSLLVEQLEVDREELFEREGPLGFTGFEALAELDRPELRLPAWTPQPHPRLSDGDVFEEISRGDVLVHHPYHSFEGTVQRFIDAAVDDPDVLAIKAAIYRTGPDSSVIRSLIDAARNGKQVAVMVELKARFDERNNLRWVRRLEEEGIHVAYGTLGLKTHSKVALVVREEADGVRLYSHVGTGNYHAGTASTYVDLGVLTADTDVGQDLTRLFNAFTGLSMQRQYRKLLVAPVALRRRLTELIRAEADHGPEGRIVAKMNALEDPDVVRELYEASMAGVDIDLVVRGICRLRPGLEGVSETVDVHSVVGRFLEHSRVFHFDHAEPSLFVGSADWMTRNLDRRVEAVVPVEDPELRAELETVLEVMLADNRRRWVMDVDGGYEQVRPGEDPVVDCQAVLAERAKADAPLGAGWEPADWG